MNIIIFQIQRLILIILIIYIININCIISHDNHDNNSRIIENSINQNDNNYIIKENFYVVIDAGSTGSRGFVFKINVYNNNTKIITSFSCGKVRYGLSTFANKPHDAIEYLYPLLYNASNIIPHQYHKYTSLYIKGTAGMRLLTIYDQQLIWDTLINDLIDHKNINFHILLSNFGTIDGHLEAYYAVIASNYIVGSIDSNLK